MSNHLLELGKHVRGQNKENTSICCCFVPERRMECAVHALGRTWLQLLAGRAAPPTLQHPGSSSSSIPAAADPFSRLCWPLLVLFRDATFSHSRSFSSLSHHINATMFFFHVSVQVFLKHLFRHAKKWWTHFLLMASSEVQKHSFKFSSSSFFCSSITEQKPTFCSPLPKKPSCHELCDTSHQENRA